MILEEWIKEKRGDRGNEGEKNGVRIRCLSHYTCIGDAYTASGDRFPWLSLFSTTGLVYINKE